MLFRNVFGRCFSTLPWVPVVFSAISVSAGSTYPIQQQPGIWPPEAPHVTYYTPPSGYPLATEYFYALQDINNPAPADVYLDWMQVHAIVNGQDIVVVENDYGNGPGKQNAIGGDFTLRQTCTPKYRETSRLPGQATPC